MNLAKKSRRQAFLHKNTSRPAVFPPPQPCETLFLSFSNPEDPLFSISAQKWNTQGDAERDPPNGKGGNSAFRLHPDRGFLTNFIVYGQQNPKYRRFCCLWTIKFHRPGFFAGQNHSPHRGDRLLACGRRSGRRCGGFLCTGKAYRRRSKDLLPHCRPLRRCFYGWQGDGR